MKTFISVLIIAFIAITTPITLLTFRVDTFLLQPEPLLDILDRQNVYERIIPGVFNELITPAAVQDLNLASITTEQVRTALTAVFSPMWLQEQIEHLVNEIFRLKKSPTTLAEIDATVSLVEPKQNFTEQTLSLWNDLGEQNAIEIGQLQTQFPDTLYLLYFLAPQGQQEAIDFNSYGTQLSSSEYENFSQADEQIQTVQLSLTRGRLALYALSAIILALFIILILIHRKLYHSALLWAGIAVFVCGVTTTSSVLTLKYFIIARLEQALFQQNIPNFINEIIEPALFAYNDQFFALLIMLGILFTLIGLVGVVLALILSKKK